MKAENVLDYPRPAICEPTPHRLRVVLCGETVADTAGKADDETGHQAWRVLETYHPPTYYLPLEAIREGVLVPNGRRSLCEWKGQASYFDVMAGGERREAAAWTYRNPTPAFAAIRDHVAFYAEPMEACFVGEERVIPQPGNFYGGWLTANIEGPVKGAPGTVHW